MNTPDIHKRIEQLKKSADEVLFTDSATALTLCLESLALAKEAGDLDLQFGSHKMIANVYCNMGSFVESLEHYNEILALGQVTGNLIYEASALAGIGLVAKQTGDYDLSLDSYEKALILFRNAGMMRDEAGILMNIGNVYSRTADFERCLKYQKEALGLYKKMGDVLGQSRVLNNLGTATTRADQARAGIIYFKKALKLIEKRDMQSEEAISLLNIGLCYGEAQSNNTYNPKMAITFIKKSLAISETMNLQHIVYSAYRMLSKIYANEGDYQNAYKFHVKFHEIKELIFNEESDSKLKKLQAIHKISQAQKESEILRLHNEKLEEDIERGKSELSVATLYLLQKNKYLTAIHNKVSDALSEPDEIDRRTFLREILHHTKSGLESTSQQFNESFRRVHGSFIDNIAKSYPAITSTELKVCALLKIRLSTKEISNILCVSEKAVDYHRLNLRKKLQLPKEITLSAFMTSQSDLVAS
ncbi:MAG: tetratricopeptide repeat protein [Bacteroidota bacterium]